MYNLLVTANCEAWNGAAVCFPLTRCLREYTDDELVERYAALSADDVRELQTYPCLFAYESGCGKPAQIGYLKSVTKRRDQVCIDYMIRPEVLTIAAEAIDRLSSNLDIRGWEMNRTHWALKDVDLHAVLSSAHITAALVDTPDRPVDIANAHFDVALSFPGEVRPYVRAVAGALSLYLGQHGVFYDEYYPGQLARPNLDTLLQDIYRRKAKLVVVHLCQAYNEKEWCGIEFRAIRDIIKSREHRRIVIVRHDAAQVDGIFSTDGYIDAGRYAPGEVADMIVQRLKLLIGSEES